jgi:hypothetical protein
MKTNRCVVSRLLVGDNFQTNQFVRWNVYDQKYQNRKSINVNKCLNSLNS